jgi:hypothetical protein
MSKNETNANNDKYKLSNLNNYNKQLTCNLKEIIDNYTHNLLNYISFFNRKINMNNHNIKYYIFRKGISTINHIFLLVLHHTKNLEVALYHSQQSYIFYIEFIEQLNFSLSDDSSSIKITVNDAILFVYNKNIFNMDKTINNCITDKEKEIFEQTQEILKIYFLLTNIFIENDDLLNIITFFRSKNFVKIKYIKLINDFLNLLIIFDIDVQQKNNLLFIFIDEIIHRKNINLQLLQNNINSFDFGIDDITPHIMINSLFN